MSVSAGPYNKLIPFVGTEEVLISQDPASDNLNISLRLSNEIGQLSKTINFTKTARKRRNWC